MSTSRKLLLIAIVLILMAIAWLWWNYPQRVDMATYVPADSLVYVEANDLPEIVSNIASTDAWKALAPLAGINSNISRVKWLGRLAAWTGIGRADMVVLSRAQVAVAVLGFDVSEEPGDTLKVPPRAALIAETHTGAARVRAAVERLVGDFARRTYGAQSAVRKETGDTTFITWAAPARKHQIVAAVNESVAVIGNDEATVQACLAVRRGERPALAGDAQTEQMRERVRASDALTFGYVSPAGAAKLLEIIAIGYAGQLSSNPQIQSGAAILLPQLANKTLGGIAWSARISGGAVEDYYLLALQNEIDVRLRDALEPSKDSTLSVGEFLPADTYQITHYNYREPEAAWRGLNAVISSQLDPLSAPLVKRFLEESLKPYGIEDPRAFLRAAGPEMVTARLDSTGTSTVLVAAVRDRATIREQVRKRLGSARAERIGDAEMLISLNEERGAASFVADRLIMGETEDVRRCLTARTKGQRLADTNAFKRAARGPSPTVSAGITTFTDDSESTRAFISFFARQRRAVNDESLDRALAAQGYTMSETRLIEGGFERRTLSSFGQFGTLIAQFTPNVVAESTMQDKTR